jgi:hypothetical protein
VHSTYIGTRELPAIFDRNRRKGLDLQWVPIESVPEENLKAIGLYRIQSLWTGRPLAELPADECKKAIEEISAKLIKSLGLCADINSRVIQELEVGLNAALGAKVVLGERIAFGDGSLIYKATQEDEAIAVKVALPSMRRPWVATDFVARANGFRKILDPSFIQIHNVGSDARIGGVTMDHIAMPSLKDVMAQSGTTGLQLELITEVLAKVTLAASNLHQESIGQDNDAGPLLVGPLRPSHIYRNAENGKIKISPIQMSQATLLTSWARPLSVLAEDELTWLAPEQYDGRRMQVATDQYYIGLLGLKLLTGVPPVRVNCFADLDKKRAFFAAPMAEFDEQRKASPALFFVLARMLERRPEDRWPSMADAHRALRQISEWRSPMNCGTRPVTPIGKFRAPTFTAICTMACSESPMKHAGFSKPRTSIWRSSGKSFTRRPVCCSTFDRPTIPIRCTVMPPPITRSACNRSTLRPFAKHSSLRCRSRSPSLMVTQSMHGAPSSMTELAT